MPHILETRGAMMEPISYEPQVRANRRPITSPAAMVMITCAVGLASVLLFLVCVIFHQEAWPAALGSLALSAMGGSLGFFLTRGR